MSTPKTSAVQVVRSGGSVSRSARAVHSRSSAKNRQKQTDENVLADICERHGCKTKKAMTFRDCRFVTLDGASKKIVFEKDKGDVFADLKSGVYVFKARRIEEYDAAGEYDVYKIDLERRIRDEKKRVRETAQAKQEIERLQAEEAARNASQEQEQEKEQVQTSSVTIEDENSVDENTGDVVTQDENPIDENVEITEERKQELVLELQQAIVNKAAQFRDNRFRRRLLQAISEKFKLQPDTSIRYVEVTSGMTPMVIEGVRTYTIKTSKAMFYVFIGDFQTKSDVLRQVDPAYQASSSLRDQVEFINRITQENETRVYDDAELEDLIELEDGSDEETSSPTKDTNE